MTDGSQSQLTNVVTPNATLILEPEVPKSNWRDITFQVKISEGLHHDPLTNYV